MAVYDAVIPVAVEEALQTMSSDANGGSKVCKATGQEVEDRRVVGFRVVAWVQWNTLLEKFPVAGCEHVLPDRPEHPQVQVAGLVDARHRETITDDRVRNGAVGLNFLECVAENRPDNMRIGKEEGQHVLKRIASGALQAGEILITRRLRKNVFAEEAVVGEAATQVV